MDGGIRFRFTFDGGKKVDARHRFKETGLVQAVV